METYNAVLEFLMALVATSVIGATVYMVITYGMSGAWAKQIDLRNLVSGPLIFGLMLLGLRYAPSATMQSTTLGVNRAADDTPALKAAIGRLVDEVRLPAERALNIDNPGGSTNPDYPYSIIITETPLPTVVISTPTPGSALSPSSAATTTAFFAEFPTALPAETSPTGTLTADENAATIVAITRAAATPTWSHDAPPTPVSGGN